jgi:signal transduction histidine kinase
MDQRVEIAKLRRRISELEQEKQAVEGFAAVAAHELLTPVVMMDACAATVCDRLDGGLDADSRRDLEALRRGAARSRLLVETLLQHARVSGRALERDWVEVDELVRECEAVLAPEIRARGATIEVGRLPRVLAEEALLGAVFMNLLVNALKYGPRRGGTIRVRGCDTAPGWRFSVRSQGHPIPLRDRRRIFEPFQRGPGERRTPGGGLGLAICREIVERHGGRLRLTASGTSGNIFTLTLPAS